jgi:hypothetical protein
MASVGGVEVRACVQPTANLLRVSTLAVSCELCRNAEGTKISGALQTKGLGATNPNPTPQPEPCPPTPPLTLTRTLQIRRLVVGC